MKKTECRADFQHSGLRLLIFIMISTIVTGCSVVEVEEEPISYTWQIADIRNNTNETAEIRFGGIVFYFERTDGERILWSCSEPNNVYFPKLTAENEAKFIKDFADLTADGELYKDYPLYDIHAPMWYAECLYGKDVARKNPLELYDYDCNPYKITLKPHSAKKVYYQFQTTNPLISDAYQLKSVKMDITLPTNKMTLLGWEKDFWHYDVSDDADVLYCLDIWYDADNPAKPSPDHEPCFSQSLRCSYCEQTIAINGDTTSDIAVTQNYVNLY